MTSTEAAPPVVPPPAPPPDGLLDRIMSAVFGRSWRTQLAGFASLGCGTVTALGAVDDLLPHKLVIAAGAMAPLIAGAGLLVAKDAKVSGLPK